MVRQKILTYTEIGVNLIFPGYFHDSANCCSASDLALGACDSLYQPSTQSWGVDFCQVRDFPVYVRGSKLVMVHAMAMRCYSPLKTYFNLQF